MKAPARVALLETVITFCETLERGGCGGTLNLERGGAEPLSVEIPPGTPISRANAALRLHD